MCDSFGIYDVINLQSIMFKAVEDVQQILDSPLAEVMKHRNPRLALIVQGLWAAKLKGSTFSEAEVLFNQLGTSPFAYSHAKYAD